MKPKMLFSLILIVFAVQTRPALALEIFEVGPEVCKKKQVEIQNSPFVIELFCEDALGAYIGIVYRGVMGAPREKAWSIENRYWQVKDWSMDVKSFTIVDDGKKILVSTMGTHGKPGLYLVSPFVRKWEKISVPVANSESILAIQKFDDKSRKLILRDEAKSLGKPIEVLIRK